ncbi:MAG: TatD family deoxyribonuclease [Lachnospiraceae bacterium]|nr:TatD family deoxyribonuclease [Lachnospiraceae bacterium]
MLIFESHAHYDDEQFDEDRDEILSALPKSGIEYVVNVSSNPESVKSTLKLAAEHDFIYAAVGIHPSDVEGLPEDTLDWVREQLKAPKVVAVGEIGLDYYWDWEEEVQDLQKVWFRRQLGLAREANLPVIIHSRDAAKETMDIMVEEDAGSIGGVVHCYSYSPEMAMDYVKMGMFIGIGGVVTFKNAKKLKETAAAVPLENIVIETDCPYLAPEPNRGKRNSSLNLPYVISAIAEIKGITEEEVAQATYDNAKRLYRIE